MAIVKVFPNSSTQWDYEFITPPTKAQMDSAMEGIGGRPRDREKLMARIAKFFSRK